MSNCVCSPQFSDGRQYVQWIGSYLHDCVYTYTEVISVVLGLLNICFWIPALMPQLWQNYKNKKVEALSFLFLLQWLLGDISNLIGCVWTEQLKTQVMTSMYFFITDCFLLSQYFYYKYLYPKWYPLKEPYENINDLELNSTQPLHTPESVSQNSFQNSLINEKLNGIKSPQPEKPNRNLKVFAFATAALCCVVALITVPLLSVNERVTQNTSRNQMHLFAEIDYDTIGRQLCDASPSLSQAQNFVVSFAAWISGLLYLGSRVPQTIQNFKRKSCEGLSISMFCLSVAANVCYGLSICFRTPQVNMEFWANIFPFIMGSLGVIAFDVIILTQSNIYKHNKF